MAKDYENCPICQAELNGVSESWAISEEGYEELKKIHEAEHTN